MTRLCTLALLALCALPLGACKSMGEVTGDITGSLGASDDRLPRDAALLRRYTAEWGQRYAQQPEDVRTALTYARALRAQSQTAQAVAVLQKLAIKNSSNRAVLAAYGKALAEGGRLQEAADVLARAHTPEQPNWSVLSSQGSVADQMGDHQAAQNYYQAALKIRPNEPSILSNLGLSYALGKQLPVAERTLRAANDSPQADMRVRQNLALVLALEGKFPEAEEVSRRDLSPMDAASNVAAIRRMIAQSDTWREIQKLDAGRKPRAAL